MRSEHRRQTHGPDGDTGSCSYVGRGCLEACNHAAEFGGGIHRRRFVGARQRTSGPAVDRCTAAQHNVFERRAFGGRTEERRRCLLGERARVRRVGPGIGFPDGNVNEHMRVETRDDVHNLTAMVSFDSMKHRLTQPAPRRIHVDTFE